ncbi:MAG: hypothetical protein GC159_09350 [Phycisphaera sp.]|nr:hypothetical protein [Phycisphaera sp.]
MLTLAMILDNPGEQPHQTRYRDPRVLAELGYTDLIVYPTTGLSGLLGPDTLTLGELRRWVGDQYEAVQQTITEAHTAGLGAWVTYDAPVLAAELTGSALTCINHTPTMLCPASDELLEMTGQCLEALLSRIDHVKGVVLRLGDSDAAKLPYLVGNDIYSPHCSRCSAMGRADRLVRFIRYFYDLVVGRLERQLIVRAWNVKPGGMHDTPELCSRVVEQLPKDDRLILSFKFTQTDFWRFQRWNPSSLVCADRPIIYELQCQREFEAKGAVPNYQAPLWRDGMPEMGGTTGLAEVSDKVNLAGLWAWVRGGGWRGPYITPDAETWIDANVYAVPKLAADPKVDIDTLARAWINERLGCDQPAATDAMLRVLRDSPQTAREAFYIGPYALRRGTPWFPSSNVVQDDQIDAEAAWAVIQRLPANALDDVVNEKAAAEHRLAEDHAGVQHAEGLPRNINQSLDYYETLVATLRSLLTGLVAYRRHLLRPDPAGAKSVINEMQRCQARWLRHTQNARLGTASAFSSDNLMSFTQRIIDQLEG